MKTIPLVAFLVAVAVLASTSPVAARPADIGEAGALVAPPALSLAARLNRWQAQTKRDMAKALREARSGKTPLPLAFLLSLAAVYGVIHSLGPGHGKLVSASYVVSRKMSVAEGAACGFGVGLLHGLSGAALVLGLSLVLNGGLVASSDQAYHHTQVVSQTLIVALGLFLAGRGIVILRASGSATAVEASAPASWSAKSLAPVVALGVVPCPGVVLIMLFCLSMGMLGLGVALASAISLGMAVTLAGINALVALGKRWAVNGLAKRRAEFVEQILCVVGGCAMAVLGLVFLFISGSPPA